MVVFRSVPFMKRRFTNKNKRFRIWTQSNISWHPSFSRKKNNSRSFGSNMQHILCERNIDSDLQFALEWIFEYEFFGRACILWIIKIKICKRSIFVSHIIFNLRINHWVLTDLRYLLYAHFQSLRKNEILQRVYFETMTHLCLCTKINLGLIHDIQAIY